MGFCGLWPKGLIPQQGSISPFHSEIRSSRGKEILWAIVLHTECPDNKDSDARSLQRRLQGSPPVTGNSSIRRSWRKISKSDFDSMDRRSQRMEFLDPPFQIGIGPLLLDKRGGREDDMGHLGRLCHERGPGRREAEGSQGTFLKPIRMRRGRKSGSSPTR